MCRDPCLKICFTQISTYKGKYIPKGDMLRPKARNRNNLFDSRTLGTNNNVRSNLYNHVCVKNKKTFEKSLISIIFGTTMF